MNKTQRNIALLQRVIGHLKPDVQAHIYATMHHSGKEEGSRAACYLMRKLIDHSLTGRHRQRHQLVKYWRFFTKEERMHLQAQFGLNFFGSKKYSPRNLVKRTQCVPTCLEWMALLLISTLFGIGFSWMLVAKFHHGFVVVGIVVAMFVFGLGYFSLRRHKKKSMH